jgi:hypothetical protein
MKNLLISWAFILATCVTLIYGFKTSVEIGAKIESNKVLQEQLKIQNMILRRLLYEQSNRDDDFRSASLLYSTSRVHSNSTH